MVTLEATAAVESFLSEEDGPPLRASAHARGLHEATGMVVMDLRCGKYYALNPVGAEVWAALEGGTDGPRLLGTLADRFEVDPARLRADIGRLLEALVGRGLVVPAPVQHDERPRPSLAAVAWVGLVAADLVIRVAGFRRLHQLARAIPVRPGGPAQTHATASTRAAVDRAARLYFKRAWCLQRSFVTTVLLRARGVPAELVIGVRSTPFMAHAWVEVEGRVVNDRASVRRMYREIERC